MPLRPATLAIVALSVTTLAAQQKPERYTERVEVSRVLIDARVLDDRGHAIDDLQVDDFTVKIGGKAARVESIEWVSGGLTADAAPLDSAAFDFASDQRRGRLIVFVFQKSLERSRIVGFMRMLIEARGLLDRLTPQDRVAVLSFDSHLQIWLDFTNDFDRVRRVFQHGILFERPAAVQESAGLSLLQRLDSRSAKRTYSIEGALRRIGDALEYLPGVKSVVLVGHGFGRLGLNGVSMENEYDAMRDALQRARASVFSLDVTEADYHSLEAGLQLVAADTGGFFARTHIFTDRAIESLVGALAGHYALFIEQPSLKRGTHRIEVELTRRKGRVLANRTYVIATRDQSSVPLHAASSSHSRAGSSCPTTPPGEVRFVPPPPYPPSAPFPDAFWHGTASLWTMLPAYRHFVETGTFREGTMLALMLHGVGEKVLPARRGRFAADVHGVELAVKDSSHRKEGWAYYDFGGMGGSRTAAQTMPKEACYNCHVQHAKRDNVFLQFYPLLEAAGK